jgi:hypothetical protein
MTRQRTELDLQAGPGGWGKVSISRDGELEEVYLRWRRADDGAWKPQGTLYAPPLSPEKLRTIPLRRILAAAEASGTFRNDLKRKLDEPAPEPGSSEFDEEFATGWAHDEPKPLPKLKRPRGRRLPDDFYAAVADLYREAAARGLNPRTTVAEQAGTSTEVAGRWVREARKRGQLPPTAPGKAKA